MKNKIWIVGTDIWCERTEEKFADIIGCIIENELYQCYEAYFQDQYGIEHEIIIQKGELDQAEQIIKEYLEKVN